MVINCPEFFGKIYTLLEHFDQSVKKESLWVMSNITAGTAVQNAQLFKSFPFLAKLISFFENDDDVVSKFILRDFLKISLDKKRSFVGVFQCSCTCKRGATP